MATGTPEPRNQVRRTSATRRQRWLLPGTQRNGNNPEATVLDLVGDPRGRGLSNIATVVGDLLEDDKLDIAKLVLAAAHYPLSVVQRAGWMIEHAAVEISKDVDLDRLAELTNRRSERTLLSSSGPRRGNTDRRWGVVVNTEVESDL